MSHPRHASENRWNFRGPRPPPDPDPIGSARFIVVLFLCLRLACKIPTNLDSPSISLFKMSNPFKSAFTPSDGDNLGPILNLDDAVLRAESDNTITPRQRTEGLAPPRPIQTDDGPQDPTLPTPTDSEGVANASEGADGTSTAGAKATNSETEGAHLPPGLLQLQADELDRLVEQRAMALVAAMETRRRQVDEDEQVKKELISLVATTVRETLLVEKETKPPRLDKAQAESATDVEETVEIDGMVFLKTPRTESEMEETDVHISKLDRYKLDAKDKEKLKSTACSPMKTKFQLMDYGKVLNGDGASDDVDFGSQLLAQQTTMKNFVKWVKTYDVKDIYCKFPLLREDQYSDPHAVARAPKIDLLTEYKKAKPSQVFAYQRLLKEHYPRPDTESSKWAYDKLTASVESRLLVQLKQTLGRRPEPEQGGVSLFYLIAIALDDNDYQNKKLVTDYLSDLKLSSIPGEDVSVFASRFKAAAHSLRKQDVPSDLIETLLKNVRECQTEEFAEIARALNGSYHAGDHEDDNAARLELMEFLCGKMVTKYRAMVKAKQWVATASSSLTAGGFKASTTDTSLETPRHQEGLAQPNPEWQAWWDRCVCDICGNPHPTKYHHDQGARNRPYRPNHRGNPSRSARPPSNRTPSNRTPQTPNAKALPQFKSAGDKEKYNQVVHKAMIDYCLPCGDSDLSANIAAGTNNNDDNEPDMYANVAREAEGDDDDDDEEVREKEMANALALMAWNNLTTY